jgi:hypothetical protein
MAETLAKSGPVAVLDLFVFGVRLSLLSTMVDGNDGYRRKHPVES